MTYEDSGWLGRDPKFNFLYFLCFFILKPLFLDPLVFLYSRWTKLRTEKRGGHGTATWHPFGTLSKPTPLWSESFVFTMKSENQTNDAANQDLTLVGLLVPASSSRWLFDLIPQNGAGRFHLLKNNTHTQFPEKNLDKEIWNLDPLMNK